MNPTIINTMLMCVAIAICLYTALLIHEAGHFCCALILGIEVNSMSIGYGPVLLQYTVKSIPVYFKAIPSGGYVKYNIQQDRFESQSAYIKKIAISLSGPFANIMAALIFYAFYVALDHYGILHRIEFFSVFSDYGHVPGIPYLFYGFISLVTIDFANIALVFVMINLIVFSFGMLPILEHDLGKSIFNFINLFDRDLKSNVVCLYLLFSLVVKSFFQLTVLFLSVMDIYQFAT